MLKAAMVLVSLSGDLCFRRLNAPDSGNHLSSRNRGDTRDPVHRIGTPASTPQELRASKDEIVTERLGAVRLIDPAVPVLREKEKHGERRFLPTGVGTKRTN